MWSKHLSIIRWDIRAAFTNPIITMYFNISIDTCIGKPASWYNFVCDICCSYHQLLLHQLLPGESPNKWRYSQESTYDIFKMKIFCVPMHILPWVIDSTQSTKLIPPLFIVKCPLLILSLQDMQNQSKQNIQPFSMTVITILEAIDLFFRACWIYNTCEQSFIAIPDTKCIVVMPWWWVRYMLCLINFILVG